MKFISANLGNLKELYIDQLEHLHSAETQITKALPKMIDKSTDLQLKQALETHLQETRQHVARLEQTLQDRAGKVDAKKNKGIAGLITEEEDQAACASLMRTADWCRIGFVPLVARPPRLGQDCFSL